MKTGTAKSYRVEVVMGALIRYPREGNRLPPALEAGEEVQLEEGGPWHRVYRVTGTAAYLRNTQTREVTVGDRTFVAQVGGSLPVSRFAFVQARR